MEQSLLNFLLCTTSAQLSRSFWMHGREALSLSMQLQTDGCIDALLHLGLAGPYYQTTV